MSASKTVSGSASKTLNLYNHEEHDLTWRGDPKHHKEQAAQSLIESGVFLYAWAWITIDCDNPMCIEPNHLRVNRPSNLEYPPGICVYCGALSSHRDHLLPKSFTGVAARIHFLTVPSCAECNMTLSDAFTWAIDERRLLAKKRIRARNKRKLRYQILTDSELAEYGPGLRPAMRRAGYERQEVEARLAWPKDRTFDLRALEKSGIDDPWALGILSLPIDLTVEAVA